MCCVHWSGAPYASECIIEKNIFKYAWLTIPTLDKKLSWLWYLPALFIDSCVNYPLLAWTQRRSNMIPIDWSIDWQFPAGQVLAIFCWSLPNWYIKDLSGSSTLPMVYTNVLFYIMWFTIQPYMLSKGKYAYKYSLLLKCIGPISSFCLNYWRDGTNGDNLYGFMSMINYDLMFMCQGLID